MDHSTNMFYHSTILFIHSYIQHSRYVHTILLLYIYHNSGFSIYGAHSGPTYHTAALIIHTYSHHHFPLYTHTHTHTHTHYIHNILPYSTPTDESLQDETRASSGSPLYTTLHHTHNLVRLLHTSGELANTSTSEHS